MKIILEVLSAAACMLGVISLFMLVSNTLRRSMERACGGTFPTIGWTCLKVSVEPDFQLEPFTRHCHAVAERAQLESNVAFDKQKRGYGIDLRLTVKQGHLLIRPKKFIHAHPYLIILATTIAIRPVIGLVWITGLFLGALIDFNGEAALVKELAKRLACREGYAV